MGTFTLETASTSGAADQRPAEVGGLTSSVLLQNALWFTRIRWIAVGVLGVFGAAGILLGATTLATFGVSPPGLWPFGLTGILAGLNLASIQWIGRLTPRSPWGVIASNIWFQVVTDLSVLTVLVYRVGAMDTVVPFAYLFHITLACLFFGRRDSFVVTLLSAILFVGMVMLQVMGVLMPASILVGGGAHGIDFRTAAIVAFPTVFVWLIVWYLVSTLSDAVRQRERDLNAANERLMRADEEINVQMLRVTHDLKAPFAGIESNIQLLKHVHWDETPESVREIIDKIDRRSMALRSRIGDILTLGNLRSTQTVERVIERVNLHDLLAGIIREVEGLAQEKKAMVALVCGGESVESDPKQLKILFSNLISNAILYSRECGRVDVGVVAGEGEILVRVADQGIGISEKALPHVFEDFYRAQEAAAFNPNSTGLGLAIVRQVARNLSLSIVVESEQGMGTAFRVRIPNG
jgi:signal transduction histidine kinase